MFVLFWICDIDATILEFVFISLLQFFNFFWDVPFLFSISSCVKNKIKWNRKKRDRKNCLNISNRHSVTVDYKRKTYQGSCCKQRENGHNFYLWTSKIVGELFRARSVNLSINSKGGLLFGRIYTQKTGLSLNVVQIVQILSFKKYVIT